MFGSVALGWPPGEGKTWPAPPLSLSLLKMLWLVVTLPLMAQSQIDFYFDKSIPDMETILTEYDFHMAKVMRDSRPRWGSVNDSAMYNKNRFEGDIINAGLNSGNVRSFAGDAPLFGIFGVQRNAVRQTYLKWTDARIPYTISSQYSSFSRSKIAEAIDEYRKKTCIDFAPKSAADQDYIHIVPDDGCYSLVGRIGGKQPVSLGDGCIQKGIIIHELMHAVGFFHEQSRADRDDYVTINWNNVEAGLQDQFDKYSLSMIDHLGTKYDYGSVMHYAPTAFSKNGKPTIEPKEKDIEIGQRIGFSTNDLYKINKLYNCPQLTELPEETTAPPAKSASKRPLTPTIGGGKIGSNKGGGPDSIASIILKRKCEDRRRDCSFLARAGHCESQFSERFMGENCPQSCGKCEKAVEIDKEEDGEERSIGGKKDCVDTRSWCERWANSGMCTQFIFQQYMTAKCAKSCQLC